MVRLGRGNRGGFFFFFSKKNLSPWSSLVLCEVIFPDALPGLISDHVPASRLKERKRGGGKHQR